MTRNDPLQLREAESTQVHDGGWRKRSSRYLFESRWYRLRQDELTLPGGAEITYTVVEHPGYAMVVPLLENGDVVMERIYRHTLQRTVLECPAGGRDGDEPLAAAQRELEEETGYRADRWSPLGRFYGSSGISDEQFELFLAEGLHPDGTIQREPGEQMEIELWPLEALRSLVLQGRLEDAPTALAVLLTWERTRSR